MASVNEEIPHYQEALNDLADARKVDRSTTLRALIARDRVALALSDDTSTIDPSTIELLTETDRRLMALAAKVESGLGRETLKNWRQSINPGEASWWWKLDDLAAAKQTWPNRIFTLFAVLFLTASIGLVADTFNLLRTVGENPISTIGTLVQAVLAFIAASAFTPAGRNWLVQCFSNLGFKNRKFKGLARTLLAFAVLLLTFLIRIQLPARAAQHFQNKGAQLLEQGLAQRAIPAYQEAAVLDPYSVQTLLALARAEENTKDYGKAIQDYKSTIALYELQQPGVFNDSYFEAKINLARLLNLHDKDYTGVLVLLDNPDEVIPKFSDHNRKLYTYFWCTYLGWANLELKNYREARLYLGTALGYREGAAARYLMGRVYEESKQDKEAAQQWTCFITVIQRDWKLPEKDREQEKEIQPDWISHAMDQQATATRGAISSPPPCR